MVLFAASVTLNVFVVFPIGKKLPVGKPAILGLDMFEVSAADARSMISLLLQRQRQRSDLSLAQVAERLGVKSRNAYARYEQGVSVPTVEKLDELLRAVAPGRHLVLQQSAA